MLAVTVVNRPICPVFVKDETTGMIICVFGIVASLYALYRIMRHYNST